MRQQRQFAFQRFCSQLCSRATLSSRFICAEIIINTTRETASHFVLYRGSRDNRVTHVGKGRVTGESAIVSNAGFNIVAHIRAAHTEVYCKDGFQ